MALPTGTSAPTAPITNEKAKELLDAIQRLTDATRSSADTFSSAARSFGSGAGAGAGAAAPTGAAGTPAPGSTTAPPPSGNGSPSATGPGTNTQGAAQKAANGINAVGEGMEKSGEKLQNFFSNISAGSETITRAVIDLNIKVDQGRAAFARSSGGIKSAMGGLIGTAHGLGMSYGEAGNMLGQLTSQMPILIDLSYSSTKALGKQAIQLNRLGVDTATFGANAVIMKKTLGLNGPAIAEMNVQLYGLGKALKIPPGVIMKDFTEAMPKLIAFGKSAPDLFAKAERYAQRLGISMQTITKQIDNFGSFEDAAEKAGNLNVIMRQNLFDTQELLYASPTEKVKIFTNALDKYKQTTGKSFTDMDVFMKNAIAQQSGFTVQELENMSKHTGAELDKLDKSKLSDTGGNKMRARMSADAAATVDLGHKMDMLKDSITRMYSSLAGNPWSVYGRQVAEAAKQIEEFHKMKKENPLLGKLIQEAQDQGAARALGGFTGFHSLHEAFNSMQLAFLDRNNIKKYGDILMTMMGDEDPALRAMASKFNMQGIMKEIMNIYAGGGMDAEVKEFFTKSLQEVQTLGEVTEQQADEILAKNRQAIFDKKAVAASAATSLAEGAKAGGTQNVAAAAGAQPAQAGPQPEKPKEGGGFIDSAKNALGAVGAWVTTTFTDLPQQIAKAGDANQNEQIKASINQVSEGLTQNVADSLKTKFEEKKSVIEESIRGPVTAAITSAFTSLQPGSAEALATANLSSIITGMQSINTVQINPENNKQIERLIKNLKEINKMTVNQALIESINKLNEAISKFIPVLEKLETKKEAIKESFGSIEGKQIEQIGILAKALEDYSKAAEKARLAATGPTIDAIKELLGAVSTATAEAWASAGVNSSDLGNAMAGPIVNELRRLFAR